MCTSAVNNTLTKQSLLLNKKGGLWSIVLILPIPKYNAIGITGRQNKITVCSIREYVLWAEWAAQVQEQIKPLPHKSALPLSILL